MLRCCGAPADWAGRTDLFQAALAEMRDALGKLGAQRLVVACSSCYQVFKANLPGVDLVSLWEVYDQRGLPQAAEAAVSNLQPVTVAVHDPCTTRCEPQIQDSARAIMRRLGYAVEELPLSRERTECCSYGGVMWLANRPLAEAVVRRRIAESSLDYVTYCAVCRDFFAGRGKRALHLLDLIYGEPRAPGESNADSPVARSGPGHSQRHENRARLKRRLLREVWGEDVDEVQRDYEAIRLLIADDVQSRLEERLILVEDIQRVIEYAERTGRKLLNPATGHLLAHYKPTAVTYWVEYSSGDAAFVVHNAYSHRMEIAEGDRT